MSKTKAILRYLEKGSEKPHRVLCDTTKAKEICEIKNINKYTQGKIYITQQQLLFIATKDNIYFPMLSGDKIKELHPERLEDFRQGQEALKDYIAKEYPDKYIKYFDDTEGLNKHEQKTIQEKKEKTIK